MTKRAGNVYSVLAAGPARVVETLGEWRGRIKGRRQLLALNERLLTDIGMTRADAESRARTPFWK